MQPSEHNMCVYTRRAPQHRYLQLSTHTHLRLGRRQHLCNHARLWPPLCVNQAQVIGLDQQRARQAREVGDLGAVYQARLL